MTGVIARKLAAFSAVLFWALLVLVFWLEPENGLLTTLLRAAVFTLPGIGLAGLALMRTHRRVQRIAKQAQSLMLGGDCEPPFRSDDDLGQLAMVLRGVAGEANRLLESMQLKSAQTEALLSSMVEGVIATDGQLRVLYCNESFARLMGVRFPVRDKVPFLELVRDPGLLGMLTEVLDHGEARQRRLVLPMAGGRSFEIRVSRTVANSRQGAVAVLHDVTDLESLERFRRDLVVNISHELRTPLTAIRGFTETLLEGAMEDPENNRKFLEIIYSHALRLNRMASDVVVLTELEGGVVIHLGRVSLRDCVDTALRAVEMEAVARGVSLLRGKIEEVSVLADKHRLDQALQNLLENAIKFNRPGGVVTVEAGRSPDGDAFLSISDTGIGIPSSDLGRVFQRFYRVDTARSRDVGGTGLGLSIVKHAVERMGGTISVESVLGVGSKFTLKFPEEVAERQPVDIARAAL